MIQEVARLTSADIRQEFTKLTVTESHIHGVSEILQSHVLGQDEACDSVARAILRHQSGLHDPNRPLGVLFFLGPTGTGKTEMAHALANFLFHEKDKVKIIDCAQFSERHTVQRLIGAPPGYIGYGDPPLITQSDLANGISIIVFDEIEKAHPALYRVLLSVIEEGTLSIRTGMGGIFGGKEDELDFRNSYIIFTSNVGAEEIHKLKRPKLGFHQSSREEIKDTVGAIAISALHKHFAEIPEFLARIDDFVVFKPLKQEDYEKIYWKFLNEINEHLLKANPEANMVTTTVECAQFMLDKALENEEFGAREIRHVINALLLGPLSDTLIRLDVPSKSIIVADIENGHVVFYMMPPKNIEGNK